MFSFNHWGNPMRCVVSVSESRDQVRGSKKDSEMTELAKRRSDRRLNLGLFHTRAYCSGGCLVASQSSRSPLSSPQAAPSTLRSFLLFDRFFACVESDLLVRSNLQSSHEHDCTGVDQDCEALGYTLCQKTLTPACKELSFRTILLRAQFLHCQGWGTLGFMRC